MPGNKVIKVKCFPLILNIVLSFVLCCMSFSVFIKTATLVSEFAVEDLLLDRTETLVPAFAVKDLSLGRTP